MQKHGIYCFRYDGDNADDFSYLILADIAGLMFSETSSAVDRIRCLLYMLRWQAWSFSQLYARSK